MKAPRLGTWLPLVVALAATLAAPNFALAATVRTGGVVEVPAGETLPGNVYVAAGVAEVAGDVDGDLLVVGGSEVSVTGDVAGDLTVVAYGAAVSGDVAGDLRVAGALVFVSGTIGGDLVAAGGRVLVLPGSRVGGDLVAAGGEFVTQGDVSGTLKVIAGAASIGGSQRGGSVTSRAVTFLPDAAGGAISYYAPDRAVIQSGPSLAAPSFNQIPPIAEVGWVKSSLLTFLTLWRFLSFASTLVLALAIAYGAKVFAQETAEQGSRSVGQFLWSAAVGFSTFVVLPVVSLLAVASIFALPLGVLGGLATIALAVLAPALGALAVGLAIERPLRRGADVTVSYRAAALGAVALALIGLVPVVGSAARLVAALAGAGAGARVAIRRLRGDSWSIEKVIAKWGGGGAK